MMLKFMLISDIIPLEEGHDLNQNQLWIHKAPQFKMSYRLRTLGGSFRTSSGHFGLRRTAEGTVRPVQQEVAFLLSEVKCCRVM